MCSSPPSAVEVFAVHLSYSKGKDWDDQYLCDEMFLLTGFVNFVQYSAYGSISSLGTNSFWIIGLKWGKPGPLLTGSAS